MPDDTLTVPDFDEALKDAIRAELLRGTPVEKLRIRCGDLEWRWSKLMRKWDLYDPALVAELTKDDE